MISRHSGFEWGLQLARRFRLFFSACHGNVALITTFMLLPMIGVAGLAIDFAAAARTKGQLEQITQIAATTAVNTARNALQVAGLGNNGLDGPAVAEGARAGQYSLATQLARISNISVVGAPTWNVQRVGNTLSANVGVNIAQQTYFAKIFGYNKFNMRVTGSMIIGLMDNPTNTLNAGAVVDEQWAISATAPLPTPTTTSPVFNDWYSGTPATTSPLLPAGGPTHSDGTLGSAVQVGNLDGSISPIISKKVYLPAGQYELRYWYNSTVVYPEYEPVYICGTVEAEMNWVKSGLVRPLGSSPWVQGTALPPSDPTQVQTTRAGVYLDLITTDPQLATTAPDARNFAIPPASPNAANNRIDICAYSSKWIQRSVTLTITKTAYFWLSFVSEVPARSNRNGFYLGEVQLCPSACAGPLNNNWPWSAGTQLYADSFETPPKQNGAAFNLSQSSFAPTANYELPPNWQAGRYGGLAAGAWDLASSFVYSVSTAKSPPYDGPTSVLTKRLGLYLYRRMLLMPGVYRFSFMAGLTKPMTNMQWCPPAYSFQNVGDTFQTNNQIYTLTDTTSLPTGVCSCPAGAITTVVVSDERAQAQINLNINNTAPPYYTDTINATGSAAGDCHAYSPKVSNVYCVLVPRTQYYGFEFRVAGPYMTTVAGTPYANANTDVQLGTSGAYLDNLQVSLLTPGVKNKFFGTSASDPGDFDNYQTNCPVNLPDGFQFAPTTENIISGGVPMWPGYSTLPLTGVTVTAPSQ